MRRSMSFTLLVPVALALSLPRPANAQFGISGGMNLTKFVGGSAQDESKTKLRLGARIGLINISSLSIGPEFYYAQRGGQQTAPASEPNPVVKAYNFSMNYLEVPIIAKLSLFKIGPLRPYVAGGPVYAWQLKCDVTLLSLAGTASGQEQDCKDDTFKNARTAYKNADKGIMFGGGVDLNVLGIGAVFVDAREVRGLDRLTEDSADGDVKSQSFSLMLGYSFGLGGKRH